MPYLTNAEVPPAFHRILQETDPHWVINEQPISWKSKPWQRKWTEEPPLPHPQLLDEIEKEFQKYGRIRRRFVFDHSTQDVPLLIAAFAWGHGDIDNRGPWKTRQALTVGEDPAQILSEVRNEMFGTGGIENAFRLMFTKGGTARIRRCNTSYATKILHFMGYESAIRPRPLIYDQRVADALARTPEAPPFPAPGLLRSRQYRDYCEWAEQSSYDPIVVEYALFEVGAALWK